MGEHRLVICRPKIRTIDERCLKSEVGMVDRRRVKIDPDAVLFCHLVLRFNGDWLCARRSTDAH